MLLADGGNEELMIWGAHGTYHYLSRGDHSEEIDTKNMQRHLWLDCSRIFLWELRSEYSRYLSFLRALISM